MQLWLTLPVLAPLVGLVLSLVIGDRLRLQRGLACLVPLVILASGIGLLADVRSGGIQVEHFGGWTVPLGISFVGDRLSAVLVILTGMVALAANVFAFTEMRTEDGGRGRFAQVHALCMGVCGAFLTGDLFNLYVWFEVLLLSSFGLMVRSGERSELVGTLRYLVLSLLSSFLFLVAVGMVYGLTGTLNMAGIGEYLRENPRPVQGSLIAVLLTAAFGIKAGIFPFYSWLPAAYPVASPAIAALFSGLLTKVGVYAILRTFTLLLPATSLHGELLMPLLTSLAVLTMVSAVLAAASQDRVRHILSFHISSQIGYMVMGIAILTPLALAGTVFYLVHHILTKTALFLVAGILRYKQGSEELRRLGGLMRAAPWLALGFFIPALSLAGIPPFSGFWAKFALMRAGVESGAWALVAAAAFTGLFTVYSMTKIWAAVFWEPLEEGAEAPRVAPWSMGVPLACLAFCSVAIGLAAGPVFEFSTAAAQELLDPRAYFLASQVEVGS